MAMTDEKYRSFLDSLDQSDCELTTFEGEFLESNLSREFFTAKQRQVIDRMIDKYGDCFEW